MNLRVCAACWLLLVPPAAGRAQEDARSPPHAPEASNAVTLPYAFYNDMFGAAGAFVYSRNGFLQKQSQLLVTGMIGTSGSGMILAGARDLLVPGFDRLFADPMVSVAYFRGDYAYVSGNPRYPSQPAGTNDSARGNYVTGGGWDDFLRVSFRYLLPIGWGRDHVVDDYHLEGGLLESGASGGESLNPLASGKTFVELRPFYRSLTVDSPTVKAKQKTNGIDVSLLWDNRDFFTNPSVGQSLTLRWSRDFGWGDSSNSWSVVAGELDQYWSLGASEWFRQCVIALDVWTADSPSWTARSDGTIANRSPTFAGANLGGLWRMRGYRFQRFSDKAVIYYSAESRMTLRWNPFARWPSLREQVGIEWIQLVPFAELGRVAPSWDLGELHTSMKWDLGLGVRVLANGLLVRVELAGSPEGAAVQMMIGQPFQF